MAAGIKAACLSGSHKVLFSRVINLKDSDGLGCSPAAADKAIPQGNVSMGRDGPPNRHSILA